jgi:hypothetical protein
LAGSGTGSVYVQFFRLSQRRKDLKIVFPFFFRKKLLKEVYEKAADI